MKYRIPMLMLLVLLLSACQPITAPPQIAATDETASALDVKFYTSESGHEHFGFIDLESSIGTDVAKYENPEIEILRTSWFALNGALYNDSFYVIVNKRLTAGDTPDMAQARLARVNMQTGALEFQGSTIPLNVGAMEIDPCGRIFTTGFTLSNQVGEMFGDTNFYRVDPQTAALTLIGDTGLERIMDMSFDPDGRLWATVGNVLYTLNMETGAPTEMAKITGVEPDNEIMGIGFTSDGKLYATTPFYDGFYAIDPITGEAIEIGHHGFTMPHGGDIPMTIRNVQCNAGEATAGAAVKFYSSHAAHEHFGAIDLVSGTGADIARYVNPEVEILRTGWFIPNGALYEDDFYVIANKRLTPENTPDDAESRIGRVDMQTGAIEFLGSVIPLNVNAVEIDACGQMYTAGFTLSNQIGELFGDTNLYRVDRQTGALTLIGNTGLERIMDLSFDPNGRLWGTTGNVLYTLDLETGTPTEMAKISGTQDDLEIMGIAFTSGGALYGTTPYADGFYAIDPTTGLATEVGRHGFEFMHGGDIPMTIRNMQCPADETASAPAVNFYTSHAGHEHLGAIDPTSSVGTDIGQYENSEISILRTEWPLPNGAIYDGAIYGLVGKRLPAGAPREETESRLVRVDMQTAEVELLGDPIPLTMMAVEVDACGKMFGAGFDLSNEFGVVYGDTNLYNIDLQDASISLIGDTGIDQLMDMSFAPDGILWATVGNVLYTLDTKTGKGTEMAKITGVEEGSEIMGIGFTSEGILYATTPNSDAFYTIDPATGIATETGRHGLVFPHGGDIPMTIRDVHCEGRN